MTLRDLLDHPATWVASILGLVGLAVKPVIVKAIFAAVWAQAGTIFTALSVAGFTLVPQVAALEPLKPVITGFALIAGALYLVKLGDRIIDEFQKRI